MKKIHFSLAFVLCFSCGTCVDASDVGSGDESPTSVAEASSPKGSSFRHFLGFWQQLGNDDGAEVVEKAARDGQVEAIAVLAFVQRYHENSEHPYFADYYDVLEGVGVMDESWEDILLEKDGLFPALYKMNDNGRTTYLKYVSWPVIISDEKHPLRQIQILARTSRRPLARFILHSFYEKYKNDPRCKDPFFFEHREELESWSEGWFRKQYKDIPDNCIHWVNSLVSRYPFYG